MVKNHSDSERGNPLPLYRFFYMHHPTDSITHVTAFVTTVLEHWLEREIAQWVYHMKDRSDDPSHNERTLLPRSYISLQIIFFMHTSMSEFFNFSIFFILFKRIVSGT